MAGDARDGTPTARAEESERGAKDETADGHGDLRWFLKVPALNFAVIAAMTACSARVAPRIALVSAARGLRTEIDAVVHEPGTRGFPCRVVPAAVELLRGPLDVCGIERIGAWSAAVMLVSGAWRGWRVG